MFDNCCISSSALVGSGGGGLARLGVGITGGGVAMLGNGGGALSRLPSTDTNGLICKLTSLSL